MNDMILRASILMFAGAALFGATGPIRAADAAPAAAANGAGAVTYTAAQATRGQAIYEANCAECHGANLDDGEFAMPLKGEYFAQHWNGKTVSVPFEYISTQMPPTNPGSLPLQSYADILAYVLSQNGVATNPGQELPADPDALAKMQLTLGS